MLSGGSAEVASLIQADVEPVDLVPGPAQERDQNGSDVAAVTRDEDPHRQLPRLFGDEIGRGWRHYRTHKHRSCDRMTLIHPETAWSPMGREE